MSTPKKIGMLTTYRNPGIPQCDWLWKQTPNHLGVWKNIQILSKTAQPDFILLYQYDFPYEPQPVSWRTKLKRKIKAQIKGEKKPSEPPLSVLLGDVPKEKVIYLLREPPLDEVVNLAKSNYKYAQEYCGYVSGPDDFAPTPGYMPAIWYHGDPFRSLNELPIPEKTRRCSWITSGIARTENHRKRLAFLRMLVESDVELDVYGRGLPEWANAYGQLENKGHGLNPYYYNLAIENYAENDWYVSEKLWDSLLGWCLPIYYGGSAADKLLPPGSFLRLPSQDEKGLAYIQEVTSSLDAWHEAKDAITEARQIILHKLNLLDWLSNFVEGKI